VYELYPCVSGFSDTHGDTRLLFAFLPKHFVHSRLCNSSVECHHACQSTSVRRDRQTLIETANLMTDFIHNV